MALHVPWMPLFAAIAVLVMPFVLRLAIAAIAGRAIGERALARQPDTIALVAATPAAWNRVREVQALEQPLLARGFQSAGVFRVRELPGFVLQLLIDEPHAVLACLYEHPLAGVWAELVVHYQDGTELDVSNAKPTGLAPRPGKTILNVRGGGIDALVAVLEKQHATVARRPVSVADAPARFEAVWAESIAYRKSNGITTAEVLSVAARRSA